MKNIAKTGFILGAFLFGMASCNQQGGAVEEAQETNEQQFEDTAMEDQKTDQSEFMTQAASSGMLEVEAGKLAQEKGQNQAVKDYAAMMVKDHTQANQELKKLASQLNITLPDSMSQEHMDQMQSLRDATGAEFDQEYADLMVSSHEEAVSLFEDASNNLENAEAKNFATTTLPKLQQHLDQANQLDQKVGGNNTNAGTPTNQ
jgi:putative membrane protein